MFSSIIVNTSPLDTVPTTFELKSAFSRIFKELQIIWTLNSVLAGDGVATEFPIQHALNSKEIDVSFYDATGNECFFNYDLTSENVITVKPDVLLKSEDGEFKVVIVG